MIYSNFLECPDAIELDSFQRICALTTCFICQDLGEIHETEQNFEKAISFYERAADLYQSEESTTSANQCLQKVAELSAQLEQLTLTLVSPHLFAFLDAN